MNPHAWRTNLPDGVSEDDIEGTQEEREDDPMDESGEPREPDFWND